jgi:GT2 family glycosyltransferase
VRRLPGASERYLPTWSHTRARTVPYVMGAALLIRRAAFDAVGGFDESFFMYAEEIDLCWRMRRAGWETHFAPVTDVVHEGRASTRRHPAEMLEQSAVSSMRFYRRCYSGLRLGVGLGVFRVAMAARIARDGMRYLWIRDPGRRRELADNLGVWRRVLAGQSAIRAR